jgi:hypothetical protein
VLPIYLFLAVLTALLLLPLTPFLHRFIYQIPTFLILIFAGCLIYNLLAFPFSRDSRVHVYFVQTVDLDTGINNVTLTGLKGYVQDVISELPSTAGQPLNCGKGVVGASRQGLQSCAWHGLAPNVLVTGAAALAKESYKSWLSFNVSSVNNTASFSIQGRNTKACRLIFDNFVSDLSIEGATSDPRYDPVSEKGIAQIRLASRTWDKLFHVNVTWAEQEAKSQTGRVMCLWSDANQHGTIPAFDEARRFAPVWTAVTKADDGLVEGWKDFVI